MNDAIILSKITLGTKWS